MSKIVNQDIYDVDNLRIASKAIAIAILNLESQGISSSTLELALSLSIIEYSEKHRQNKKSFNE